MTDKANRREFLKGAAWMGAAAMAAGCMSRAAGVGAKIGMSWS